jgi:hypothetical protein
MIQSFKNAAESVWVGMMLPGTMSAGNKIYDSLMLNAGLALSLYTMARNQPTFFMMSAALVAVPILDYYGSGYIALNRTPPAPKM